MTALLFMTAALLLVSGLVKLRAAERVGLGVALLPLVELLAALTLGLVTVMRRPSPAGGLAWVVGAFVLLVASSLQVGSAIRRRNRRRTLSEGARLQTYLRYLSRSSPPDSSQRADTAPGEDR